MYASRKTLYSELERARSSKVIAYVTGDRPGMETQISGEAYDLFVNHLDAIGVVKRISVYLYTRGGVTLAAWSLVNLIRQFCDEYEVIIPSKAHSAGTLMCLGASKIVMTKQATLGPIDPSINNPLNPPIPGGAPTARVPVSVEDVSAYLDLARSELNIQGESQLAMILNHLSDKVHPLVLGVTQRSKSQIQMLARKLISTQIKDQETINRIISFLCIDSGSHDYTIHRKEARDELRLLVEKPNDELYRTIKALYDDIASELSLASKFDVGILLAGSPQVNYCAKRVLVESVNGGSDYFATEGVLGQQHVPVQPNVTKTIYEDRRVFEGWKHEC